MLKPLKNKLIIEPIEVEHKTISGIEIALHSEQSKLIREVYPFRAKVLYNHSVPDINEGDIIIYNRLGSQPIDDKLAVVDHRSVLAIESA